MPPFTHHIFVCGNQRSSDNPRGCCDPNGKGTLRAAFKASLKRQHVEGVVRANGAGCLDQCELGPIVVIYPQAVWYGRVTLEDVDRIVEETIVNGQIVTDLLIDDDELNASSTRKAPTEKAPTEKTPTEKTEQ